MSPDTDDHEVVAEFLTVDLDLESPDDLSPLIPALAPMAYVLHCEPGKRGFSARFELESGRSDDPAVELDGFRDLIEALAPDSRAIWDSATLRQFSIGIQGGTTPQCLMLQLPPETLARVCSLNAQIDISVYAAVHHPPPPNIQAILDDDGEPQ